jgi:hypothetical protein
MRSSSPYSGVKLIVLPGMSRSLGVPWHPSLTLRRPPAQAASLGRPAWVRRLAHVLTITMNEVARQI